MDITFIGGGNMAQAMIGGLLARGHAASSLRAVEINAAARDALASRFHIACFDAAGEAALAPARMVVLAVKPQQLAAVARGLAPHVAGKIVLSIAAGVRLADLARWLRAEQGGCTLVRAMPNTPALIGKGVTGLAYYPTAAAPTLGRPESAAVETLAGAIGSWLWLADEARLDAVTAVSGSGPGYVFLFIEALEAAARELGFTAVEARRLAVETFNGAAALAAASDEPPTALRAKVTSKGGTTEAALASLERDGVRAAVLRAVEAAQARARALGDELARDGGEG